MKDQKLRGRRIAVLATDGFERVELEVPVKAYRSAGAEVEIVSLRSGKIKGVNHDKPANQIAVNRKVSNADPDDYDALLIPGGLLNPDLLRQSADARNFAKAFDDSNKPIAAICHGPWVLASAGVLSGRTLTSWPSLRDDMVNAGATWLDQEVVQDGNLVTSRSPLDLKAFVKKSMELFALRGAMPEREASYESSAPQPNQPPKMAMASRSWFSTPSLTVLALGAAAAMFMTSKNRTSEAGSRMEGYGQS